MSTDAATVLLRSPLDRTGPLPLHEQLRSSIEIAIISGDLSDGDPLPSVRGLSKELGIAPSTVVRVYRDLLDTQLVKSVPQRGYFVTTSPELKGDGPGALAVRRLIDEVIDAAVEHGVGMPAFVQLVLDQVRRRHQEPRRIAVVGHRDASLADRVACVAEALADLPVKVIGLSFQELKARNEAAPSTDLAGITWFLVPIGETREAATLLGPHARRVVPMNRTLRPDVREFLASQPVSTRFGIITGADFFVGRVLTMIKRVHPLLVPPIITSMDHPAEVERVLEAADTLILGSYAYPELESRLPPDRPSVNLASLPDEGTLRRLRALVVADVGLG